MKLKLSRSQKKSGKETLYCLDARVELTSEEKDMVKNYHLGKKALYNSAESKDHLDKAAENIVKRTLWGIIKARISLFMSKIALNVTVDSLVNGQHIESKDMDELLEAEGSIKKACEDVKNILENIKTFDGTETVFDI